MDHKCSTLDKSVKSLKEQLKETEEHLADETRQKIALSNKLKQQEDEVQRLNQQLEDEEEIKAGIQTKMVQATQQVRGRRERREGEERGGVAVPHQCECAVNMAVPPISVNVQ